MYGMAEMLEYTALMSFAYGELASYYIFDRKAPHHISHLIKILFAPVGSPGQKCKDEVGALKGLGIAAVLVHEKKHWGGHEMDEFRDLLANELEQDAWKEYRTWYKQIKDANHDLLVDSTSADAHDIRSLNSSMSNVALAGGSKPNLTEELHLLFDEYAFWHKKALRSKTGRSAAELNKSLHNIAQKVQRGGAHAGSWQRKPHFKRTSLWQCTENMGQMKPPNLPQSPSRLVQPSHSQYMGIGHQPVPTAKASVRVHTQSDQPTNNTCEATPLPKRKFANLTSTLVTTPSGMNIVDTATEGTAMDHDAADAIGMLVSNHAPKAPKLGVKGMANATFDFAGRTVDFSSAPAAPQAGIVLVERPKKLQDVGVANVQATKMRKEAKQAKVKEEVVDVDGNKENIPVESNYDAPKVEEGKEDGDDEMLD